MKMKNRVLIAGLMAIAVSGASTFAYFTSNLTIPGDSATNPLELNITNGKVEITGKIGDGSTTANWTYDVARYSTTDYDKLGTSGNTVAGITTSADKTADITAYENKHRSPDIDLDGGDVAGKGWTDASNRVPIGTGVKGKISNARPGDAFVLGNATAGGNETNAGLHIENTSTLSVKIDMGLSGNTDEQIATFNALNNAGFKLFVGKLGASDDKKVEQISTLSDLNSKLDKVLGTSIEPGNNIDIYIRVELPLVTNDDYKSKTTQGTSNLVSTTEFDITKLFTIRATQENNPGWGTNGD